jgi:hypothetical protein
MANWTQMRVGGLGGDRASIPSPTTGGAVVVVNANIACGETKWLRWVRQTTAKPNE